MVQERRLRDMASTAHEETPLLRDDHIDADASLVDAEGADADAVAAATTAEHRRRVIIVTFAQVIMIEVD